MKLNDTKTEFIIFSTPKNVGKVVEWTVDVGDAIIIPSGSVRNIGAMLNPTLNMETHIISMKRACYLQLRSLPKILKYLTQEAAEKLTHAFVTSRLDNLNSLLINTPSLQVQQLQLIQNTAARIDFKVLLQVYKYTWNCPGLSLFQTSGVCMPQAQHDNEICNGHSQTGSAFV